MLGAFALLLCHIQSCIYEIGATLRRTMRNSAIFFLLLLFKGFSQAKWFWKMKLLLCNTKQAHVNKIKCAALNPFFCCRHTFAWNCALFSSVKVIHIILNLAQFQNKTKTKSPSKHCWQRYTYKIILNRIFIVLNCLFYWLLKRIKCTLRCLDFFGIFSSFRSILSSHIFLSIVLFSIF